MATPILTSLNSSFTDTYVYDFVGYKEIKGLQVLYWARTYK